MPRRSTIEGACTRDASRLNGLWRRAQGKPADASLREAFDAALAQSVARREARAARLPQAPVDPVLPIAAEAERIVALIRTHQVVVIAGETGSGKTTQLPKLCLAAGRGSAGMIGCTQPRRIAARAVARRVAEELQVPLGGAVGFQVRFNDNVGADTAIKFMTDGILLAEIASDRWLSSYDTLIIDEAHERSLNIDFLLGYLQGLLKRRPDLKLIVTSATIDTARFAAHFGNAPVVDVEGRGYPVETRYRPMDGSGGERGAGERGSESLSPQQTSGPRRAARESDSDPLSVTDAIVAACDEIARDRPMGDTLIFLPGEREIRDAHRALEARKYRHTEVLPLYARLSAKDQDRVFNPGTQRRIVLATNVAETSLTVPRIHYVVDPGLARVKRYSPRQKLDRLHIEPVSQASANQRKGRCGRIAPGICYRLYAQADFESRPEYTDPEIRRAALAGVILRMLALGLGDAGGRDEARGGGGRHRRRGRGAAGDASRAPRIDADGSVDDASPSASTAVASPRADVANVIESFPFLEPPDPRAVADGWQQLQELGAVDERRQLTAIGRTMARLPVDVKLARMLIAAEASNCLADVLTIASFLGIQDPRERPADQRGAADAAHAEFRDPKSEFVGILNLWNAYRTAHEDLTQSALRKWCDKKFLGFLRMREWRELHRQLKLQCEELGWASQRASEPLARALASDRPWMAGPGSGHAQSSRHGRQQALGIEGAQKGSESLFATQSAAIPQKSAAKTDSDLLSALPADQASRSTSPSRRSRGSAATSRVAERKQSQQIENGRRWTPDSEGAEKGSESLFATQNAATSRKPAAKTDSDPFSASGTAAGIASSRYAILHRALIAGLPTQLGQRTEKGQYDGPRGRKFQIFPGSTLASKPPAWLLSATLLDTEKVWSLTNAAIEPEWAIAELPHLLARRHFDPRWSRTQGRVIGSEQISLFGLVLAPKKPIHYGGLYPEEARALFLRDGLVTGEINTRSAFVARNRKTLAAAEEEEAKQRRAGLVVDDEWMAQWYQARIPPEVVSAQALDAWYAKLPKDKRASLEWTRDDLLLSDGTDANLFPEYLALGDVRLAVRYRFEPGAIDDGMTVAVPLHLLNALDEPRLSWLAPGFVNDKAVAMIRSLPKPLRRSVVPAPDFARAFAQAHGPADADADAFAGTLARFLKRMTGVDINATDFDEPSLDPHLRANLRLLDVDEDGKPTTQVLAESRDLDDLRARFGARAMQAFAARAAEGLARDGLTAFPDTPVPESVPGVGGVPAYPALHDDGDSVSLAVHADPLDARREHPRGIRRLLAIALADKAKQARKQLPVQPKTALLYAAIESASPRAGEHNRPADHLREDLVDGALAALADDGLGAIRDADAFAARRDAIAGTLFGEAMRRLKQAETILALVAEVRARLDSKLVGWARGNLDDMQAQLSALVPPGFLRDVTAQALAEYPRYLKALAVRAERALNDPVRDQQRLLDLAPFVDALNEAAARGRMREPDWQALRWDLEELRVSLFAQELGAKGGVSPKKLAQRVAALRN